MKQYKAIFFDWDGTAVESRKAPVDKIVPAMKALLQKGVKLAIISGTTLENIAGGRLHEYFSIEERQNLFYGLGRGAFQYGYDKEGELFEFASCIPGQEQLLKIHEICYQIHARLLKEYQLKTDIVFSRPNYCKIDLMVSNSRGEALFLQEGEREVLEKLLVQHGFFGGFRGLISLAEEIGIQYGVAVTATTDAKYLEVGISSKSNNVDVLCDYFSKQYGITPLDSAFWGDEYIGFGDGIYGSDSFMITEYSRKGDFFDVSDCPGNRPKEVRQAGGGVETFRKFLVQQKEMIESLYDNH